MKPEQAIYTHRIHQRADEELVFASYGDTCFALLVKKTEMRDAAIKVFGQALDWAKESET